MKIPTANDSDGSMNWIAAIAVYKGEKNVRINVCEVSKMTILCYCADKIEILELKYLSAIFILNYF